MMITFKPTLFVLALITALTPGVSAQQTPLDSLALEGCWQGYWESPRGYYYEANAELYKTEDDNIGGTFLWTMKQSPRPEDDQRLGLQGTEYVSGMFDPKGNLLTLEGYDKNDPDTVIGLDKYRLVVADNGQYLAGVTSSNDTWDGLFRLQKVECPAI